MIEITNTKETDSGWEFEVRLDQQAFYQVSLRRDYWRQLTAEKISPEELVEKSFGFLLEREPKESILQTFDLSLIQTYFSDYESIIKSA